jgi:hypothetical protein
MGLQESLISLHTMSGRPQHKAIQLKALAKNQVMVILVDSSSSHVFANSGLVDKLQVLVTSTHLVTVMVANGDTIPCSTEVKNFEWWCQGHTFRVIAKVL